MIIFKILNTVREGDGEFVKLESSGPVAVEESQARITIAQALRDNLNQFYRSSRQHKQRKRLQIKRATATAHQLQQRMTDTSLSLMNVNMGFGMPLQPDQGILRQVSNGSECPSLKQILDEAVGLATASSQPNVVEEETVMDDVFTSLFKAFAPPPTVAPTTTDPFEPTPLKDDASYGSLEDDWEPLQVLL